jgi:hypothetical protein
MIFATALSMLFTRSRIELPLPRMPRALALIVLVAALIV